MSNRYDEQIQKMSFEVALKELETIVSKLENGNDSLEQAIEDYEYGDALRKYCETKLKEAKLKVEKIVQSQDGNVIIESVSVD